MVYGLLFMVQSKKQSGVILPSPRLSNHQCGRTVSPPLSSILPSVQPSRQFEPACRQAGVFIKAEALMKMYREQGSTGIASVLDTIFSSAPLLQKSLELTAKELQIKIQIKDQKKLIFGIWYM